MRWRVSRTRPARTWLGGSGARSIRACRHCPESSFGRLARRGVSTRARSTMLDDVAMLDDVQSRRDDREIALDHAGVSDLRYPITVLDRQHEKQRTVATVSMSVGLPHHFKGTHMSRFI